MNEYGDAFEEKKIHVRVPNANITNEVLQNIFRKYGTVYINLKNLFAFVEFETKELAEAAIRDLDNKPPLKLSMSMARKKAYYEQRGENGNNSRPVHSHQFSKSPPSSSENRLRNKRVYTPNNSSNNQRGERSDIIYKSSDRFTDWLDKEHSNIVTIMKESNMSLKDCILTLTKRLIDDKSEFSTKEQFRKDMVMQMGDFIDSMRLSCSNNMNEEQASITSPNVDNENNTREKTVSTPREHHRAPNGQKYSNVKQSFKSSKSPSISSDDTVKHKKTSNPSKRFFTAFDVKQDTATTLKIVAKKSDGLICLAIDTNNEAMMAQYNSLFDEFASCCAAHNDVHPVAENAMMAIEQSKGEWYRAMRCSEGWALVDVGTITPSDKVLRVVPCPDKYKRIPEFVCFFKSDPVSEMENMDANQEYSFSCVRKRFSEGTIYVKVVDKQGKVVNGLVRVWNYSGQQIKVKEEVNNMSSPMQVEQSEEKPKKVICPERISILDVVQAGDKLDVLLVESESLGQVCIMCDQNNPAMVTQYQSLLEEFAEACENEKTSPPVSGKVMAVRLIADNAWYRAVSVAGGWALLDDGHTVTIDKVNKHVLCPKSFHKVPEFCVLLTNALPLKPNIHYTVHIVSKSMNKTKVKLLLPNDPSNEISAFMVPFAEFREEQTMSQLLNEKVNNSMLVDKIKRSCLTKLDLNKGSTVVIVNQCGYRLYLRHSEENSEKTFYKLLDKLTFSGPKLCAVTGNPETDDMVICEYGDQFHRAAVERYYPNTKKCDLFLIDIGVQCSVSCSLLKVVPIWATEVPIMTASYTLSNVEKEAVVSHKATSYITNLIKVQAPLKCVDLSSDQVVLEIKQTKQNINEKVVDLYMPNWTKIVKRDGILQEPIVMESDMKYTTVTKGQKIKILRVLEKAFSVSVIDPVMEDKLLQLTVEFTEYCSAVNSSYLPRIEELCFYKDESGSWGRGLALSVNNNDTVVVMSLDYGIVHDVHFSKCRKMLKEFAEPVPFLAVYATLSDIGSEPTDNVFMKAYEVLKSMDTLIVDSATCVELGVYDIKIKDLSSELRALSII